MFSFVQISCQTYVWTFICAKRSLHHNMLLPTTPHHVTHTNIGVLISYIMPITMLHMKLMCLLVGTYFSTWYFWIHLFIFRTTSSTFSNMTPRRMAFMVQFTWCAWMSTYILHTQYSHGMVTKHLPNSQLIVFCNGLGDCQMICHKLFHDSYFHGQGLLVLLLVGCVIIGRLRRSSKIHKQFLVVIIIIHLFTKKWTEWTNHLIPHVKNHNMIHNAPRR